MQSFPNQLKQPLVGLLWSVADDKLMLAQRNADWTGRAPVLEEDIAFSALAQDDLAHASALYELVAKLTHVDANRIAFGREPREYLCAHIVELDDDDDWALAIVRQFFCAHFEILRLERLARSSYEPLRALAVRLAAEERLSLEHADSWVIQLGRGGPESKNRMQAALERLAPLTPGLFEPTAGVERLEDAGVYPRRDPDMFESWSNIVSDVIGRAGLQWTLHRPNPGETGGRRGKRSEAFQALYDEMTEVYRLEPKAEW